MIETTGALRKTSRLFAFGEGTSVEILLAMGKIGYYNTCIALENA